MTEYISKAEDNYFVDLIGDETFEEDLVKFFTGGRYNYTQKEIEKLGAEGLANDFVEHMRYQTVNETTAVKDLMYAKRDYGTYEKVPEAKKRDVDFKEGKKAFGRLMQAYDKSEGGGTGPIEGAWDYMRAFGSSPSTIATVGSLGTGIFTKIAAQGTKKGTQIALRAQLSKLLAEGITETAAKETLKKGVSKSALKAAAPAFAFETGMGTAMSYAEKETRYETSGQDYTAGEVLQDGLIEGVLGGTMAAGLGMLDARAVNKAIDITTENLKKGKEKRRETKKKTQERILSTNTSTRNEAIDEAIDITNLLAAKQLNKKLDPLDPEMVAMGQQIKDKIATGSGNEMLDAGIDTDTVKSIAAAAIELREKLKIKPGERISQAIANALNNDKSDFNIELVNKIKDDYGLTSEQFSYIFLAELSKAGKLLGEVSAIKRSMLNLDQLANEGISTIADREAMDLFEAVGGRAAGFKTKDKDTPSFLQKVHKGLQESDSLRIAFMTSQLGTTAANVTTQSFNTFVDISDHFWKNVIRSTIGEKLPDGTVNRKWVGGTLSTLRGLSMSRSESILAKDLLMAEAPLKYRDLFYENTRTLNQMNSNSFVSRVGRAVNIANIGTDAVFKQAQLYSALDRKLRENGTSFSKFIKDGNSFKDLPEGVLDYAINEAKRFTFQRDYKKDKSLFGKGASKLQKIHKEVPFLISVGADIPFPRYLANHLEYINDYTPIGMVTGGLNKFDEVTNQSLGRAFSDNYKTGTDRLARQLTGASLLAGGVYAAAAKEGELDFDRISKLQKEGETDLSRIAGPWAMNLLLGDLIYRYMNDLPMNKTTTAENVAEVLGGIPDLRTGAFSLEFPLVRELYKSIEQNEATDGLEKQLGNIIATFSYPATIARDAYAQINFDSAGNAYTRPMLPGEKNAVSTFGERNLLQDIMNSELLKNQASRFLLDSNMFSYNQSRSASHKKGYDFKIYSIFNPNATSSYNPITRQFGAQEEPPSTALQKEITKLNLKDYKLYTNKSVGNHSMAYQVQYNLSQTLYKRFEVWKSQGRLGGENNKYANLTYDELDDLPLSKKEINAHKAKFLESWIDGNVEKESEAVKLFFEDLLNSRDVRKKRKAIGYIRNSYELATQEFGNNIDNIIIRYPERFKGMKTARDYLADSDSIEDEIDRRQHIMDILTKEKDKSQSVVTQVSEAD